MTGDPFRALPAFAADLDQRLEAMRPRLATVADAVGHMVRVRYGTATPEDQWMPATRRGLAVGASGYVLPLRGGMDLFLAVDAQGWDAPIPILLRSFGTMETASLTDPVYPIDMTIAFPPGTWRVVATVAQFLRRSADVGYYTLASTIHTESDNQVFTGLSGFAGWHQCVTGRDTTFTLAAQTNVVFRVGHRGHANAATTYGYRALMTGWAHRVG